MTVKHLIELLQALPQDLPVYLGDWSEDCASDMPLSIEDDSSLPRVVEADERPPKWNHPKRVVIG